jgi:hypothetical protein
MRQNALLADAWQPPPDLDLTKWIAFYFDRRLFEDPVYLNPSFGCFRDTDHYGDVYLRMQICAFYDHLRRHVRDIADVVYQICGDDICLLHVHYLKKPADPPHVYGGSVGWLGEKRKYCDVEEATAILDRYQGGGDRPPWKALAEYGFGKETMYWHWLHEVNAFGDDNLRFVRLAKERYFSASNGKERDFCPLNLPYS